MGHDEIVARETALEERRMKVREIVHSTFKSLGKSTPDLKFWLINCPESKEGELVHYHSKDHVVCVSEYQLRELNLKEIEDKTKGMILQ